MSPKHIVYIFNTTILRIAVIYLSLCVITAQPAHAGEAQDAPASFLTERAPVVIICFDPASGEQEEFSSADEAFGNCPKGHTAFLGYEVELTPGADPLPFEPQEQQEEAEVGDAPMDQQ